MKSWVCWKRRRRYCRGWRLTGRHLTSQLGSLGLEQGQGGGGRSGGCRGGGRSHGGVAGGGRVPHVGCVGPQVRHQLLARVEPPATEVSPLHPGAHELRSSAHCQWQTGLGGGGRGRRCGGRSQEAGWQHPWQGRSWSRSWEGGEHAGR